MMPDMSGEQTFQHLRTLKVTADTPVVFVTAKASEKYVETLMLLGAAGVITKPFDPMALSSEALSLWRQAKA
jgi:CheY-like chemotaxis protein